MTSNLFLNAVPDFDAALEPFEFQQSAVLFEAGQKVDRVYFPFGAAISLVVSLKDGTTVESALVGRDGLVGAISALGDGETINRGVVQIAGDGMVCEAEAFKQAILADQRRLSLVMRHEQALFAQAQQSTACNSRHPVEARLARWVLRASDIVQMRELRFTQETVAVMLGVQRASVSLAAHELQSRGLIKYSRGKVRVTDYDGLKRVTCECYQSVQKNYARLWSLTKTSLPSSSPDSGQ